MKAQLKVKWLKEASREQIGQLPKPQRIPNKRRKLLEKARGKDRD